MGCLYPVAQVGGGRLVACRAFQSRSLREVVVLLSFFYVALARMFGLVALLARSEASKELEILVLRHELQVLRRQVARPPFREFDRAVLVALSRALPRGSWVSFSVRPETLMRWHRRLVARRWTYSSGRPGRPPLDGELAALIVRLARENPRWGYQRIAGELLGLGFRASATSVRRILARHGLSPAPRRVGPSWRAFLRAQGQSMIACDFLTVDTVWLKRIYVLVFIELSSRRAHLAGCTTNPTGVWAVQQARNLTMTLADQRRRVRFIIHDRDAKFSAAFDAVFQAEGVRVVRTPFQAPNANAHAERFVGTLRRECLDWLLILNCRQLERALRTYIDHYNHHRPHRSLELRAPFLLTSSSNGPDGAAAGVRMSSRPTRWAAARIPSRGVSEYWHPTGPRFGNSQACHRS